MKSVQNLMTDWG